MIDIDNITFVFQFLVPSLSFLYFEWNEVFLKEKQLANKPISNHYQYPLAIAKKIVEKKGKQKSKQLFQLPGV
jgi:hypothetical protein